MAAGSTYSTIATTTLGSAQSSVTFSSLGSYTDIIIIVKGYQSIDDNVLMRFNSDTGANYSSTTIFGSGSAASSFRSTGATSIQLGGLFTSDNGNAIYHLMNYSNSTTYKTVLARANAAGSGTQARVGLWRSTAAITSVTMLTGSGNFQTGSTFTLYGITAA